MNGIKLFIFCRKVVTFRAAVWFVVSSKTRRRVWGRCADVPVWPVRALY